MPKTTMEPQRCEWCLNDPLYVTYHDTEWGVPEFGRDELFERLVLESMQAGLSWLTVLKKRAHMRTRFFDFKTEQVAAATEKDVAAWLQDPGIIRHRGKLEAMIGNARLFAEEANGVEMLWSFAPKKVKVYKTKQGVPNTTPESEAMSKALKKKGYRFVGPTICYAFMQSVGMVNDHILSCWRHQPCKDLDRSPSLGKRG